VCAKRHALQLRACASAADLAWRPRCAAMQGSTWTLVPFRVPALFTALTLSRAFPSPTIPCPPPSPRRRRTQYIIARMRADAEMALQEMEARLLLRGSALPVAPQAHTLGASSRSGATSLVTHAGHATTPVYLPSPAPPLHLSPPSTAVSRWLTPQASPVDQLSQQWDRAWGGEADGGGWEADADGWDTDGELVGEQLRQMAGQARGMPQDRSHLDVYIDSLDQTISFAELIDWFPAGADLVYDSPRIAGGGAGAALDSLKTAALDNSLGDGSLVCVL